MQITFINHACIKIAIGNATVLCDPRMTKSLAVGSLNAMGLAVSPKLFLNPRIVTLLLWRLGSVVRGMSQGVGREGLAPAPADEMPNRRPQ